MSDKLRDGVWYYIRNAQEHETLLRYGSLSRTDGFARVQKGKFCGPGRYLELTYNQRCPRNCCDDFVRELVPAEEVVQLAREEMRELAAVLKTAKTVDQGT